MLLSVVVMRQSRWHIQSDMMFVQPWSSNKAPGKDGVVTGTICCLCDHKTMIGLALHFLETELKVSWSCHKFY